MDWRTIQDLKQRNKSRGAIRKEYYVNAGYGIIHVEKPTEYLIRQQRQTKSGCAASGAGVGNCKLEVEVEVAGRETSGTRLEEKRKMVFDQSPCK